MELYGKHYHPKTTDFMKHATVHLYKDAYTLNQIAASNDLTNGLVCIYGMPRMSGCTSLLVNSIVSVVHKKANQKILMTTPMRMSKYTIDSIIDTINALNSVMWMPKLEKVTSQYILFDNETSIKILETSRHSAPLSQAYDYMFVDNVEESTHVPRYSSTTNILAIVSNTVPYEQVKKSYSRYMIYKF